MGLRSATVRIGIGVGDTNTDSVCLDLSKQDFPNRGIIAHFEIPTTPEVTLGAATAISRTLEISGLSVKQVACVSIGTTSDVEVLLPSGFRDRLRLRSGGCNKCKLCKYGACTAYFVLMAVYRSMPLILLIGLEGGPIVGKDKTQVVGGPESVGHYLTSQAQVIRWRCLDSDRY